MSDQSGREAGQTVMNKLSREDRGVEPPEIAPCLGHGEQDERWMRHAMALAARAEGETGELPVGTAPMFKAQRQYKEVRA
ncbi:hypothetical protein [Aeromonas sp. MR7]|uniref:hypothetical protein n=1 Tax=Aeromonas sp. MR7 TaxID=2923419 RepID=UPI00403F9C22